VTPEKRREYNRRYRAAHKEEIVAKRREYVAEHKDEVRAWQKAYKSEHRKELLAKQKAYRDSHKDQRYVSKYGLTFGDVERLVAFQGGRCAICGEKARLVVDHCHTSGRVRGLLCRRCNVALGGFGDDVGLLRRAVQYLSALPSNLANADFSTR